MNFEHAVVKFNGGRGALLCNKCRVIIRQNFDFGTLQDKKYFCQRCDNGEAD